MSTFGKIRGLEFDRAAAVLIVTFESGRRFRFVGVDEGLFSALRHLETRHQIFSLRIADHFAWTELPELA